MSVMGICHICQRPAARTCRMCSRPVCSHHYSDENTACERCSEDVVGVGQGQRWY